jgi:hypothetical protein
MSQSITTDQIPKIEINRLVKNGYILKGRHGSGSFQATDSDPILTIESELTNTNKFLTIEYNCPTSTKSITQVIALVEVQSNIKGNRGTHPYFVCPVTKKGAKILYYNYEHRLYACKTAFPDRKIYYRTEICSRSERIFERGYLVQKRLLKKLLKYKNYTYRGDLTNIHEEIGKLIKMEKAIEILKNERSKKIFEKLTNK